MRNRSKKVELFLHGMTETVDKRSIGYKRRLDALKKAPEIIPEMIDRTLKSGIHASYVLMDSWFTHAPLIRAVCQRGLDVIGMVKLIINAIKYRAGIQSSRIIPS
jgi:hypothetical protein